MRVLIDTNVLIDYIEQREPFCGSAEQIVNACANDLLEGCIAAHSVSNMFYILRKHYTVNERRQLMKGLCTVFEVVGIDKEKILSALNDEAFEDFEDCLQDKCAAAYEADVILTRNIKDFRGSFIKCMEPDQFAEEYLPALF